MFSLKYYFIINLSSEQKTKGKPVLNKTDPKPMNIKEKYGKTLSPIKKIFKILSPETYDGSTGKLEGFIFQVRFYTTFNVI